MTVTEYDIIRRGGEYWLKIRTDSGSEAQINLGKGGTPIVRDVLQEVATVPFDEDHVREYLDRCILHWRESDEEYAEYYVDCFQSVRTSLFGETLDTCTCDPADGCDICGGGGRPDLSEAWDVEGADR